MKRVISIFLTLLILTAFFVFPTGADENFFAVISLEGLTLGQGFYELPCCYSAEDINRLLGRTYTEDELTAELISEAFFKDKKINVKYENGPAFENTDTKELAIPPVITENGGPSDDKNVGQKDNFLGAGDYGKNSAWIITVNNSVVEAPGSFYLKKEDVLNKNGGMHVIRWQFSLTGDGRDLGYDSAAGQAFYKAGDKDRLFIKYALSGNKEAKESVLSVMEDLTAAQAQINAAEMIFGDEITLPGTYDIKKILKDLNKKIAEETKEPGTEDGKAVTVLLRSGYYKPGSIYTEAFYKKAAAEFSSEKIDTEKLCVLITAMCAGGKNPAAAEGRNLYLSLTDEKAVKKEGIKAAVYALIALDAQNFKVKKEIRQEYKDYITSYLLDGKYEDKDLAALAVCSLSPYADEMKTSEAVKKAFDILKTDCFSHAAGITAALSAWGYNPGKDSRFIKDGKSVFDAFMSEADKIIKEGSTENAVKAVYALSSYIRFINRENRFFDMSDTVKKAVGFDASAILSLPEKIENKKDTYFNAIISIDTWDNSAGIKLIDFILSVPSGLEVTAVKPCRELGGGELSYNTEKGKLRAVYFDAEKNSDIKINSSRFPAEIFIITLRLKDKYDTENFYISLSGMSLKRSADKEDEIKVDTSEASGTVTAVNGFNVSGKILFRGDGVDLIPEDKTAVSLTVTGIEKDSSITFTSGDISYGFFISPEITEKTGVPSYVGLISSDVTPEALSDPENYSTDPGTKAPEIIFGDADGSGSVNAQDALDTVNVWLRKKSVSDDREILAMNINSDGRINTFDALGISEYFVYGTEFQVASKAADTGSEGIS